MSRPFTILSSAEQEIHDEHPKLNAERRKYSFYQSCDLKSLLKDIRGASNKIYFAVCYGYFKETAQFYETANSTDIAYVAKQLKMKQLNIKWEDYGRIAKENHRKKILEFFSFRPFDEKAVSMIKAETVKSLRSRKSPKTCFREIIDLLKHARIEIPPYYKLATIISVSYNQHRAELLEVIHQHLTPEARKMLDELTEKPNQDKLASDAYALTLAKRFTHSIKPAKVRKNVVLHSKLLQIFQLVKPIIEKLNLNSEGIRSFAAVAEYSQVFQVKRKKDDDRYLHLIVFVANQLYRLQDLLVDTLLRVVKSLINQATKEAKEEYFKNRIELETLTTELAASTENVAERLNKVTSVLTSLNLTDGEKVQKALNILLPHGSKTVELKERLAKLQSASKNLTGDAILIRILCEKSKILESRCKDIVLGLTFDYEGSDRNISAAIKHYVEVSGRLKEESCLKGFLKASEKKHVESRFSFNMPLYKVYFFQRVANALKSGALNLKNAYEYTTLESNLISRDRFKANRQQILEQAELSRFSDSKKLLKEFRLETNALFKQVNVAVSRGENPYVVPDGSGGYHLSPERNTAEAIEWDDNKLELYPKDKPISLVQAIATVNKATRFRGSGDIPPNPAWLRPSPLN